MRSLRTGRSRRSSGIELQSLESRRLFSGPPAALEVTLNNPILPDFGLNDAATAGGIVYTTGGQVTTGEMLWAGNSQNPNATLLLTSVGNGYGGSGNHGISGLTVYHDQFFFYANTDSSSRNGLFTTNGTVAGTTLVRAVGGPSMTLSDKTVTLNDRFYFFTHEGTNSQLVISDGTAAGTMPIISIPDSGLQVPTPSHIIDGKFFFSVSGNLWVSDGSSTGTHLAWTGSDPTAFASNFVSAGGKLFFKYSTAVVGGTANYLYVAKGDGSNAFRLSFAGGTQFTLPSDVVATGSRVVFSTGNYLGVTDGTQAGTMMLVTGGSIYEAISAPLSVLGSKAVFLWRASNSSIAGWYVTDGTSAGTTRLMPVKTGSFSYYIFSARGRAYLQTTFGDVGNQYYQTDGTSAGTRALWYLFPGNPPTGLGVILSPDGPDQRLLMEGGQSDVRQVWSIDPTVPSGSITGIAFTDVNRDGIWQRFEPYQSAYAYIDLNGNGVYDAGVDPRRSAVDRIPYLFDGLMAGHYVVRMINGQGNNLTPLDPASGQYDIDLQPGQNVTANFIMGAERGVIWGVIYDDANGNGVQDPGEPGLNNHTVFLDLNNNGYANTGEPTATSDADGSWGISGLAPGTYVLRQPYSAGFEPTTLPQQSGLSITLAQDEVRRIDLGTKTAQTGAITGTVWTDFNHDGVRNGGDPPRSNAIVYLDFNNDGVFQSGESTAATNSQGRFTFSKVNVGQQTVRLQTSGTLIQTFPAGGAGLPVIIPANGTVAAGEFLCYGTSDAVPVGKISGSLWLDGNGDQIRDPQETAVAGRTVYIDADNNGQLNDIDSIAITDASGNYLFDHRANASSTYIIREVVPADWEQTLPAAGASRSVTLTSSTPQRTGIDFGSRPTLSILLPVDGTCAIVATSATDHFTLSADGTTLTVNRNGTSKQVPLASLTSIRIAGSAGADSLDVLSSLSLPLRLEGGVALNVAAGAAAKLFPGTQHVTQLHVDGQLDVGSAQVIVDELDSAGSWNGSQYTGIAGLIAGGAIGAGQADGWLIKVGVVAGADRKNGNAGDRSAFLRSTFGGDANLDGKLNVDDYIRIDAGITAHRTGWSNGDFNLDGRINIDDYAIIDSNVLLANPPADPVTTDFVAEPAKSVRLTPPSLSWPESRDQERDGENEGAFLA